MWKPSIRFTRSATGLGLIVAAISGSAQAGIFTPVPEIDAGSLMSGIALLSGGALILTNRVRRPKSGI